MTWREVFAWGIVGGVCMFFAFDVHNYLPLAIYCIIFGMKLVDDNLSKGGKQ